jgi:hypothetical protein
VNPKFLLDLSIIVISYVNPAIIYAQEILHLVNAISTLILTIVLFIGVGLVVILILAVLTTVVFIQYLPMIFDAISKLGHYHKIVIHDDSEFPSCEYGESLLEKIWSVFKCNIVIAIPLFIVLLYIFNPSLSSSNNAISALSNTTANATNSSPVMNGLSLPDMSFILALCMVPAFLLSLRILVNPTYDGFITFENGMTSNFSSSVAFVAKIIQLRRIPDEMTVLSENEERKKIRSYKEQIISFYFSFVGATLILFFLFVFFQVIKTNGSYDITAAFLPTMSPLAIVLMIVAEILAILCTTIVGEYYLKLAKPLDQM